MRLSEKRREDRSLPSLWPWFSGCEWVIFLENKLPSPDILGRRKISVSFKIFNCYDTFCKVWFLPVDKAELDNPNYKKCPCWGSPAYDMPSRNSLYQKWLDCLLLHRSSLTMNLSRTGCMLRGQNGDFFDLWGFAVFDPLNYLVLFQYRRACIKF